MIVRILGVGQYTLDDADISEVEKADDAVQAAIAATTATLSPRP